jgi:hypothetical protein
MKSSGLPTCDSVLYQFGLTVADEKKNEQRIRHSTDHEITNLSVAVSSVRRGRSSVEKEKSSGVNLLLLFILYPLIIMHDTGQVNKVIVIRWYVIWSYLDRVPIIYICRVKLDTLYGYIKLSDGIAQFAVVYSQTLVHEQIFRTQGVSDDVLCLELRTRKPSTSWSDKQGVSASVGSVVVV